MWSATHVFGLFLLPNSMNYNIATKPITHLYTLPSIDIQALLPKKERKHADKYLYILHLIYVARKVDKRNTSLEHIPLSAKILEEVLSSRKYRHYLNFWIDLGVIECDDHYIPGEKSKGYRFTKEYRYEKMIRVAIQDPKFKAKLTRRKELYLQNIDLSDPKLSFLYHNLKEVRVGYLPALSYIHQHFKEAKGKEDKFNEYSIILHEFAQEHYFFNRDKKGRRVHNNFVNFPRLLRHFLHLETGEQLVNLDVRNSQPLMLCVLLKEHYQGKNLPLDVQAYILQCQEGRFYEAFSEAAGIPIADRKQFKQKLFAEVFFGRNESSDKSQAFQALKTTYPNVAAYIADVKKQDYKSLAVALQRVESKIIIDGVIGGLAADYHPEDFFALTIHDSITTTLSNKQEVMMRMEKAFAKEGIKATINAEFFEMQEKQLQVA